MKGTDTDRNRVAVRWRAGAAGGILLSLGLSAGMAVGRAQDNLPADKMTVAASTTPVLSPGAPQTLMSARIRTSTPEDLLLQVTAECSILTTVQTTGNTTDPSSADGTVEIWVEVDGQPVSIQSIPTGVTTPPTPADNGHVVFCNRSFQRTTSGFLVDQSATIRDFEKTKAANAFNWAKFNTGNGIHTVAVRGVLTATASNGNTAQAVVGNRTLVVQPTSLAQNQTSG